MLLHNNHWDIIRQGALYFLRPPASIDIEQELIPLQSKNGLLADALERQHAS